MRYNFIKDKLRSLFSLLGEKIFRKKNQVWTISIVKHTIIVISLSFIVLVIHKEIYGFIAEKDDYIVKLSELNDKIRPTWATPVAMDYEEPPIQNKNMISDDALPEYLCKKLELSPWIKKVWSVHRIYPNSVEIKIERRQPRLAIKVANKYYIFVDDECVRLPGYYGSLPEIPERKIYVVTIKLEEKIPPPGKKWDSNAIYSALEMANTIDTYYSIFNQVGISAIDVSNWDGKIDKRKSPVVLITNKNTLIYWGGTSFTKRFGEISVNEKIKNLALILKAYPEFSNIKVAKVYIKNYPSVIEGNGFSSVSRR